MLILLSGLNFLSTFHLIRNVLFASVRVHILFVPVPRTIQLLLPSFAWRHLPSSGHSAFSGHNFGLELLLHLRVSVFLCDAMMVFMFGMHE